MIKRGHVEKPCRKHGYNQGRTDCYYCYRRWLIGTYTNSQFSPEERLLNEIFMTNRYFTSRPKPSKVRETTRRQETIASSGMTTYSWKDGSKLLMG